MEQLLTMTEALIGLSSAFVALTLLLVLLLRFPALALLLMAGVSVYVDQATETNYRSGGKVLLQTLASAPMELSMGATSLIYRSVYLGTSLAPTSITVLLLPVPLSATLVLVALSKDQHPLVIGLV
jgi:hypothetical protein